jgi:SpoVK/Ycf46/Vps4 family AAA+-type ATPase
MDITNQSMSTVSKSNGGVTKEVYSVDQLLFEKYVANNFNFNFEILDANKEKALEVLNSLKITKHKFDWDLSSKSIYFEGLVKEANVLIVIDLKEYKSECSIAIFAETLESMNIIYQELFEKAVKDFILKDEVIITFSDFSIVGNQITENLSRMKLDTFKTISEKYYPFIDMDIFIHEFLTRQESILVLTGESGTGKTKFSSLILKKAIENYDLIEKLSKNKNTVDFEDEEDEEDGEISKDEIRVAYLKNEDILASDQFWSTIKNKKFDFIILDDLDYMLIPRTREVGSQIDVNRSKFISQLLSFTDGVIPTTTKFIITSNRSDKDVDSALMRPGRMFGILSFRSLSYAEALDIWNDSGLKDKINIFNEVFKDTDSTVSHAELGSLIYQSKLTSERRTYIKNNEKNIVLTEKSKKESGKKMGFNTDH